MVAIVGLNRNLQRFVGIFGHLTFNSNVNIDGVIFKVEGKLNSRELKYEIVIEK